MRNTKPIICADTISKRRFSRLDLLGQECSDTLYEGCDFTETDLSGTSFENCAFVNCNISNAVIKNTRFIDVEFRGSKLVGMAFCNCDQIVFDVAIYECSLLNCNFTGLKMKRGKFISSEIQECWFEEAFLVEADFSSSEFAGTLFHQCDLKRASFQTARGYSIDPRVNDVRGASFSVPEVLALLAYLGIKIV